MKHVPALGPRGVRYGIGIAVLAGVLFAAGRLSLIVAPHNHAIPEGPTQVNSLIHNSLLIVLSLTTMLLATALAKRAQAEEAARQAETRYRALFDHVPIGLYHTTPAGEILDVNPALVEMMGYPDHESVLRIKAGDAYLNREDRARVQALLAQNGQVAGFEVRWRRYDGTPIWVRISARAITDEAGRVLYYKGAAEDITHHKQIEQAVFESQQALQTAHAQNEALLASISWILIGVSAEGRITHWNAPAAAAFGIPTQDVLGRELAQCGIQWNWAAIHKALSDCRTKGEPVRLTNMRYAQAQRGDGFLKIVVSPLVGTSGEEPGCLLLGEDITERKILESQLVQAQKLEAIGQLAAGIAHEINTPTQYIGDNISFIRLSFNKLQQAVQKHRELYEATRQGRVPLALVAEVEYVQNKMRLDYLLEEIPIAAQEALEGVDRVSKIVRAVKEFSYPGSEEKSPVDINEAIESTITVARNEWKYVADMETDLDPSLPPVACLAGPLKQVILNMLINAAHAIADVLGDGTPGKGQISIATRRDGDWVEIRLSDTGAGIPEAVRSKIFDPFFTTKQVGKGTGQGLTIAHAVIVEKHGGTITFDSQVGRGTTFIIRLPIEPAFDEAGGFNGR